MMKFFYLLFGLFFLGLGWVGVFIPGFPTTVFILISLWFFLRSNKRLYEWVKGQKVFAKPIKHIEIYENHRSVTRKVKILSQGVAWLSVFTLFFLSSSSKPFLIALPFAISCSIFMNLTKTYRPKI